MAHRKGRVVNILLSFCIVNKEKSVIVYNRMKVAGVAGITHEVMVKYVLLVSLTEG